MTDLPKISVVICTRDRPKDLAELLHTLLGQIYRPFEVVIVDDSLSSTAEKVVNSFQSRLSDSELRYIRGYGDGLPAARNLGIKVSNGNVILFLDDDTLLERNVLHAFAIFLGTHKNAIGVQGQIRMRVAEPSYDIRQRVGNAVCKVLMLFYYEQNRLAVRRSGTSIFPYGCPITEEIEAQRLDGCCMCYRRQLFNELSFDTNLKRWGFMEDLDFSFRVYKKHPGRLYVIPYAIVAHKKSRESRLPSRTRIDMATHYWFYVFFKDIFESSILNLMAFLLALTGNLVTTVGELIIKRKPKRQWWELVYLLDSYFNALRYLREIKRRNLGFFNRRLKE